jgi:hypothetical protein
MQRVQRKDFKCVGPCRIGLPHQAGRTAAREYHQRVSGESSKEPVPQPAFRTVETVHGVDEYDDALRCGDVRRDFEGLLSRVDSSRVDLDNVQAAPPGLDGETLQERCLADSPGAVKRQDHE